MGPRAWKASTAFGRWRSRAARHRIFCMGAGGEQLERCHARFRLSGCCHDAYDCLPSTLYFGVTYRRRVIATARLIVSPDVSGLPTGRLLDRLAHPPRLEAQVRYSEPSRLGVEQSVSPRVRHQAILALVGIVVDTSARLGYERNLLTLRGQLIAALWWLPWRLTPPFLYPEEDGGPITTEPIWAATLNLHELAAAVADHDASSWRVMFPKDPPWLDGSQFISHDELEQLTTTNRNSVKRARYLWQKRRLELDHLAPTAT